MLNKEVLETYSQVVLHKGCAVTQEIHKWEVCPAQEFYRRIGRKHQHWLQSSGLTIGIWIDERKYTITSNGST